MISESRCYVFQWEDRVGTKREDKVSVTSGNPYEFCWGIEHRVKDIVGIDTVTGKIKVLRKDFKTVQENSLKDDTGGNSD